MEDDRRADSVWRLAVSLGSSGAQVGRHRLAGEAIHGHQSENRAPRRWRVAGCSIVPQLAEILNEGYELEFQRLNDDSAEATGVVSGPIITRYRDSMQNLRTTFLKIIKRAGLKPWPKLFQNLRSTRETELPKLSPSRPLRHGSAILSWLRRSTTCNSGMSTLTEPQRCSPTLQPHRMLWPRQWPRSRAKREKLTNPSKQRAPKNTRLFAALQIHSHLVAMQ